MRELAENGTRGATVLLAVVWGSALVVRTSSGRVYMCGSLRDGKDTPTKVSGNMPAHVWRTWYKLVPPHVCTERCGIGANGSQTEANLKTLLIRCSLATVKCIVCVFMTGANASEGGSWRCPARARAGVVGF